MPDSVVTDLDVGRNLVLDELFDLSLYRALRKLKLPETIQMLDELVAVEAKHLEFWQDFFRMKITKLDLRRRIKLNLILSLCRIFGSSAVHLVLEAIEVFGIKKYLTLWEMYRDTELGPAVKGILTDEFQHEDLIVTEQMKQRINPERVRSIFLGLNDGLVEILGAVSGYFAAFGNAHFVLIAGLTTACAGALSMAAGAYVAASSGNEVARTQRRKSIFLGQAEGEFHPEPAFTTGVLVGISYFIGAGIPLLPVVLGSHNALPSILMGIITAVIVSALVAFFSGMDIGRRVRINVMMISFAVAITYGIGMLVRQWTGIAP